MRAGATACAALLAAAATLSAQPPVAVPSPGLHTTPAGGTVESSSIEGHYGPAEPADLDDVVRNASGWQKHHVLVKGVLGDLLIRKYLALADGTARVMLIPMEDPDYRDFATLIGAEVEVHGIVRMLPGHQATVRCRGEYMPETKCEDPLLPVLPDHQTGWPEVSITIVSLSEAGPGHRRPRAAARTLEDVNMSKAAADGKPLTMTGQFRGANLCGDLPPSSQRDAADWVLLTSEGAVWVVGHRPEGRGFSLDPARPGDTTRWLQVRGKVEVTAEARYVRPGSVELIPKPAGAGPSPCAH
jgi:hypothetical protein